MAKILWEKEFLSNRVVSNILSKLTFDGNLGWNYTAYRGYILWKHKNWLWNNAQI